MDCAALHRAEYGVAPAMLASAPGSLHLLGEHIEFTRGRVMSLALPQRAWVAISPRPDHTVRIWAANYKERKKFPTSNLKFKKEDRWANLTKGILFGLDNLGCELTGLDVTISSEITEGRSMGASSAIGAALALALVRLYNFELSNAQLVYLVHTAESKFMGRVSSLASCYVSLHAHAGALFCLDIRDNEFRHLRLAQVEYSFWVLDSMAPPSAQKEEIAAWKEYYDELKIDLKKDTHGKNLRDFPVREAKEMIGDIREPHRHLARFIIEEESRMVMAEDTVEASNMPPFGKILVRSHEGLRVQYEISCPEIDWLVRHGTEIPGILGGRLSGRGMGGIMVFFAQGEPDLSAFLDEYERIFGFQPRLFRAVPSHKAQTHHLSGEAVGADLIVE
jgi:galactokinase